MRLFLILIMAFTVLCCTKKIQTAAPAIDANTVAPDVSADAMQPEFIFESCATEYKSVLKENFTAALKRGLTCLKQYRPQDRIQLIKLLTERKPTLRCNPGISARAYSLGPGDPAFPGLEIRPKADSSELPEVLFHETVHWLGYLHNGSLDVTYLTSFCCFENDEHLKQIACDMIAKENSYWLSDEYLKKMSYLFFKKDLEQIAIKMNFAASQHLAQAQDKNFERPLSLYLTNVIDFAGKSCDENLYKIQSLLIGSLLASSQNTDYSKQGKSISEAVARECYKPFEKNKLEFFKSLAAVVAAMNSQSHKNVILQGERFLNAESAACASFTTDENIALKDFARSTSRLVLNYYEQLREKPNPPSIALMKKWLHICEPI